MTIYADQPDPVNTAWTDDGTELVMTSTASHNMWDTRAGALILWTAMPTEEWAATVRKSEGCARH